MKKKVSFLTFALARGGTEKVVAILLQELYKEYSIYLVLTSKIIEYPIPPEVQVHFIDNGSETEVFAKRFLKLPILAWRYYKFCKKNNIDISISFLNRPNYIACMLRYFSWKKKIFISERTSTFMQYKAKNLKSKIGRSLIKRLYPKADLILTNSKANITDLKIHFNITAQYLTVYNPIDLNTILRKKEDKVEGVDFTKFTYIMLGRFVKEKDHLTLVEAFSMLPHKDECQLLLIGHGENMNKIKLKVKELKLTSQVLFLNFVENPYKYLSKSHCFVLSSLQEGFPNVLIEALACSLPVIATDCKTGPRELLAPGTDYNFQLVNNSEIADYGILTPVNNSLLLSKAMELLFENKILYEDYKSKAQQRAACFDISVITKEYKQILDNY